MATSMTQRVSIAVIAVVMVLGTVGFYFITIMSNNDQSQQQKKLQEQLRNQQKILTCTNLGTTTTEPALSVPEVYMPSAKVTKIESTDLQVGNGSVAQDGDCLVMKYYGTLASDGKVFDENYTKTTVFSFVLGKKMVIAGWDKGLPGMKVGGIRRLVIPATQAYGADGNGGIPPNADLVFVVKLVRIES